MEKQIHASEWKIMEYLWEESPRTLMQIVESMSEQVGWAKSTVTTMVSRMEAKGLLRFEEGGKAKLIYPAVSRDEVAAQESNSLLNRVFGGSVTSLMAQFVSSRSITREEIDGLYELLRQAEAESSDE